MLHPSTWRWFHWALFVAGLIYAATYFGFIELGSLDDHLNRLAAPPEATADLYEPATGRASALFIVLAFLFMTPPAFAVVIFVSMFVSEVVTQSLRALRVPHGVSSSSFWVILATAGWLKRDAWLPHAQWFAALLARAFLVALKTS
jgi:hypothetical protein